MTKKPKFNIEDPLLNGSITQKLKENDMINIILRKVSKQEKVMNNIIAAITLLALLLVVPLTATANDSPTFSADGQSTLHRISPKAVQMVIKSQPIIVFRKPTTDFGYKIIGGTGPTGVVCCTNWNTATGGTGCATYPDSCDSNQFEVTCGGDGCW
ncbi:MAG: hypothetical protein COB30_000520 [Ectothiorhodospiraceae bacterium]|nr:hypothetical protein [Ectothiorhodospiraceae bacterium]